MLAHASLCNRTNSPLGTSQLFTIAQLHQHLQLLETEQLLRPIPTLLLLLRMLNNCVRACSEQVEELARAVEVDVCLDVLEILLIALTMPALLTRKVSMRRPRPVRMKEISFSRRKLVIVSS